MENKFQFYNTLTRKVETVIPHEDGKIGMYTCGPTVYHFAHIGNLRSYIMEDVLEKSLRYVGYDVKRVMNITDVGHLSSDADTGEDKMLKGAKREHKTVMEIAKYYTDAFFSDCKKLNIKTPTITYSRNLILFLQKQPSHRLTMVLPRPSTQMDGSISKKAVIHCSTQKK